MLPIKLLLEAAHQMHTYGELRPGFIDHDSASIAGPSWQEVRRRATAVAPSRRPRGGDARATIKVRLKRDPLTGGFTVRAADADESASPAKRKAGTRRKR